MTDPEIETVPFESDWSPPPFPLPREELLPPSRGFGVLGKKWTISILNYVAAERRPSFTQLLRAHPPLSRRILWVRLNELQREGYLRREDREASPYRVAYILTEKGRHAIRLVRVHSDIIRRFGQ